MPKCSLKNRILQLRLSTCVCSVLCLIAAIQFFACYGKYNYPHLPVDVIETQLFKETNPNLVLSKSNTECSYGDVLSSKKSINSWEVPKNFDDFVVSGVGNGSYAPRDCSPSFSVALLVTYRNREEQLKVFLPYMHNFLRKQKIHYKIYLIEQQDEKPWNKGALYNIGAQSAIRDKFPCLILHDVDLLPLDDSNLYACTAQPRHMSASIDKFRYVLTYDTLVGGVMAIRTDQYVLVNGLSNEYEGWGGEDDDFAARLLAHRLDVVRFPREMSRYTMLRHPPADKNRARGALLAGARQRAPRDGLAHARYRSARCAAHRLFTHVQVRL